MARYGERTENRFDTAKFEDNDSISEFSRDRGNVAIGLERVEDDIDRAFKQLSQLRELLDPVLNPGPGMAADDGEMSEAKRLPASPLAGQLEYFSIRIRELTTQIASLVDKIDL